MVQSQRFEIQGNETMVCKLQKMLYGLKQAPKQWYNKFDNFMSNSGFDICQANHYSYIKFMGDSKYITVLC